MRRHPWLTAAMAIVVLGAVLYFSIQWRAEQHWLHYAAEARARGVKLQLTDFTRPEIPDDQNFAALPMMRKAFAGGANSQPFEPLSIMAYRFATFGKYPQRGQPDLGDPFKGQTLDWVEWQTFFREVGLLSETSDDPTRDVLRALEHYAPEFQEWSQWRSRPACRFPLDLQKGAAMPLPHLGAFMNAAKLFTLRMRAHQALGDSAAAYEDFQEGLQAYRMLREEPTLIVGLVRTAAFRVLLAGVGEGLRSHAWQEPELKRIEADLRAIPLWSDYRFALASERGFFNTSTDSMMNQSLRERGKHTAEINFAQTEPMPTLAYQLMPRSVFRDNQLRMNHYFDELTARIDAVHGTFNADGQTPSAPQNLASGLPAKYYFLCGVSGPVYRQVERRYFSLQIVLDETRLAGALERFRLAHGAYPETLAELVPEFLAVAPVDFHARAPYRYQRIGPAGFRLYSVGENHTDEGGQLAPYLPEQKQLDAVWPYAPPGAVICNKL